MKRALVLTLIVAACLAGFLSIRGTMPFLPVFGTSMEPALHAGNLILIDTVKASDVKVGDIVVVSIPPLVRDAYRYPPVIAHRVKEIRTDEGIITFRTKGDNTGEDPFTVRPQDIKGTVGDQIPYLGFPLLFFQSSLGSIFVIVALSLLALYLYADEIGIGKRIVHRGVFAPVIEESTRGNRVLAQKVEATEKEMAGTQQALQSFASAIAEYAEHLKSHTSAIQGLASASHELREGAAEQNRVLARIAQVMEQPRKAEPRADAEEMKKIVRNLHGFEQAIDQLEHKVKETKKPEQAEQKAPQASYKAVHKTTPQVDKAAPKTGKSPYPPGCVKRHHPTPGRKVFIAR